MKHVSIVQNTQSEWLGHIEDHLEGRGIRFGYHRPFADGGRLPDIMTIGDGLMLVGGGAWGSATNGRLLPSLDGEVKLARACLMLGKPVIGFGLGSQILALAADGTTSAAPLTCSVDTARRIKDGALAGHLPESFRFVRYGRDRAVPPAYAEILAVDEAGEPAVWQIGANVLGFTGHLGVRPAMIEDLVMEFDEVPADVAGTLPSIARAAPAMEDALVHIMTGMVEIAGWMR